MQTATIEVPVDHADLAKGNFQLALARHVADPKQRIGSLLVNPGGPGFGGTDFAKFADQIYSPALLAHLRATLRRLLRLLSFLRAIRPKHSYYGSHAQVCEHAPG